MNGGREWKGIAGMQVGVGMGGGRQSGPRGWAGMPVCLRGAEGSGKAMGVNFPSAILLDSNVSFCKHGSPTI